MGRGAQPADCAQARARADAGLLPSGHRELWPAGATAQFEYHCYRGHDSGDAALWYRSHQPVTVLSRNSSELDDLSGEEERPSGFSERGDWGMPYTYTVRWPDGHEGTAVEDELYVSRRFFDSEGGPPPVEEILRHDPTFKPYQGQ